MNNPSKENLIRLKLEGIISLKKFDFDINRRKLIILHTGNKAEIEENLSSLNLESKLLESSRIEEDSITDSSILQSRLLKCNNHWIRV